MKSIKDIISAITIKISPERLVATTIKNYFQDKKIIIDVLKISINQQEVFLKCDPYIKTYIKINQNEILGYLKNKIPQYKINKIS